MLDFRKTEIEDGEWITKLLRATGKESYEYCFGNLFCWGSAYGSKITRYKDFLVSADFIDEPSYAFPMGSGNLKEVVEAIRNDASERGVTLSFFGLTQDDKRKLRELYDGEFVFSEDRDYFDYIYRQSDLANLEGKKYHGKRNHISAFEKDGNWEYEEITEGNIQECIEMNKAWLSVNTDKDAVDMSREQTALALAFSYYRELQFKGALLRKNGQTVAFTMGEEINEGLFCTHFEKAFSSVRGAYPMINREFARRTLSGYEFINREEDAGDEGLRKAKLSYRPSKLLVKYTAQLNER